MKGSKDGRPSGAANINQQPSSSRASARSKHQMLAHQPVGSASQRKTSQMGAAHTHSKSTNNSTSVKSRQNGGGSTSGHRASASNSHQANTSSAKDTSGQQAITNFSQYGLVPSQHRRADTGNSSAMPSYQASSGDGHQQIVTSTSNLKSAKAKTKSTHLPSSLGYAQLQAAANEGFNIYANGRTNQSSINSGAGSKTSQKHSRHQSNPSQIMLQGSAGTTQPQQQVATATATNNTLAVQPSVNVQIPKAQQVTLTESGATVSSKSRSKQINQSSAIVGNSSAAHPGNPHNQRFNSNKFGTQANTSRIQKVQVQPSAQASTSANQTLNTTAAGSAAPSSTANKTGGAHKKSSSMANSKITQLLLKAGSKHYNQQHLQAASALYQHNPAASGAAAQQIRAPKPVVMASSGQQQSLPQKQRDHQNINETQKQQQSIHAQGPQQVVSAAAMQEAQQQFVSSYDVPTRGNDLLIIDAARLQSSGQQVYTNINRSMDMAQQINAYNHSQQVQQIHQNQQQLKEAQADQHLQHILQVDQQAHGNDDMLISQNNTYQEHLSKFLVNKHKLALNQQQQSTQSSHLATGSDGPAAHKQSRAASAKNGTSIEQHSQSRPTSIELIQQHQQQETSNKSNQMVMLQQPMFFAQQLNPNQQINQAVGAGQQSSKGSAANTQAASAGIEKIAKQSKVVSGNVAVRKPSSSHVKNLSVNQKGLSANNHSNIPKQAQQKIVGSQQASHQRTKSDQVGSDLTLIINMGKVIQNQRGKVGEILKNNFIDAQIAARPSAPPGSIPVTSGKASAAAKQMRTYTGGDRSKAKNASGMDLSAATAALSQKQMVALGGSSVPSKTSSLNARRASGNGASSLATHISKKAAIAQAKHQNKTIQEKYEELESKYNELLEQLEHKRGDGSSASAGQQPGVRVPARENQLQREANQASLSSLSSKNFNQQVVVRAQQQQQQMQAPSSIHSKPQQHPPQMNPRMIRYINNQQKMMHKGDPASIQPISQRNESFGPSQQPSVSIQADTRSADLHTVKHQQVIDMSQVTLTSPFDHQVLTHPIPPNNSNQVSVPVSSTASQQPQNGLFVTKRKQHNRVNTHFYGQQIGDPHQKVALRQNFQVNVTGSEQESARLIEPQKQSATALTTRAEAAQLAAAHIELYADSQQKRKLDNSTNGYPQQEIPVHRDSSDASIKGKIRSTQTSNTQMSQNPHLRARQQPSADLSTSKTQQTPRTTIHSQEQLEKLQQQHINQQIYPAKHSQQHHMQQETQSTANVARHTRMLWQNIVNTNNEKNSGGQSSLTVPQSSAAQDHVGVIGPFADVKYQAPAQKPVGSSHRRSISDGNNPNGTLNFRQGSGISGPSLVVDRQKEQATLDQSSTNAGQLLHETGKQSLSNFSMQQRKRLEQQQLQTSALKGSTRSHSRSKKYQKNSEVSGMQPADITSLESADNHHHPNSQLIFAQIAAERKSQHKKAGGAQGRSSQSKENVAGKKIHHLKKPSNKNLAGDGRSTSKGPSQGTKLEAPKKSHNRIKSNSYRQGNRDSSLVGPLASSGAGFSNNDPSMEGSIQNPSSAVLNGRFIEMAQAGQAAEAQQHQKIIVKRGQEGSYSYENQYVVDMSTKEGQKLNQQQPTGNKGTQRAFHHPALSQPNPWVPNMPNATQQDMFIVQENTPSTISDGHLSNEGRVVYPTINSRQDLPKPSQFSHSPILNIKNKPQLNNLLKSQGPSVTVYKNQHPDHVPNPVTISTELKKRGKESVQRTGVIVKKQGREVHTVDKKRSGGTKNQATEHPICQANAAGHIKNKLSNLSEENRAENVARPQMNSNHKRHKSDIVESQRQSYHPLINPVTKQGERAKPQQAGNPIKREVNTAQISPNRPSKADRCANQSLFFGGDDLYAANDKVDDKKLVNISIDDLNDDEMLPSEAEQLTLQQQQSSNEQRKIDRSKWIEVIRENGQQSQPGVLQQRVSQKQYGQKQSHQQAHMQQDRDPQGNEKRKKFMQAYQMKMKSEDINKQNQKQSSIKNGRAEDQKKSLSKKRVSHPQSAMLIEEGQNDEESQIYIQQQLQNSSEEPNQKYKNIMSITKKKSKSKSQLPPHLQLKNSQSSLENDSSARQSNQYMAGPNLNSAQELVKIDKISQQQQYQGIPADSQQSQNNIHINMNIPSEIQDHQEKLKSKGSPPADNITQRSLVENEQRQAVQVARSKSKSKKSAPKTQSASTAQKVENSQEVFVPLNTLELKNFKGVDSISPSQDKQGLKAPKASVQKNNFIPEDKSQDDLRIETYSSIELDNELTAKEKIMKKICKYVRLSFEENNAVPLTTVDFYRIGKILGKGAFGKVNLALNNLVRKMVAIKSINKQYFGEDSQRRKVLQEVVILKQTRHKHIVRLFEYFETHKHILFVLEIAAGGDLLNYVRKRRQLKEDVAKSVFKQVVSGLHYCHSKGILHRDIKLDNILLSADGEVKICDFGVSKVIRRGEILTEQCGTPAYIAPEILKDRGYEGFGVDIWSAGVVLYAMLYGIVPFRANNMNELQKMIIRADYKLQDCISKEARDMLNGLLEKDPAKRMNTRQILAHPWMADAKDSVQLFTQAEKNYIRSEYTYTDTTRYNRNNGTMQGGPEYESDAFVDAMLDTNENSILKNAETKSVILAPFNSTKSNIETGEEFLEQVRDLLEDRRCIKFAPRVREIAKQYEVNNNAELDNGVQHDFLEEEAKAQVEGQQDDEEGKQGSRRDINLLDQLIKQEESQQVSGRELDEGSGSPPKQPLDPYKAKEDVADTSHSNSNLRQKKSTSGNKLATVEIGEAQNSLAPSSHRATIPAQETLILDEDIIEKVSEFGYPREALIRYLNENQLNNATTAYWLLQMDQQQQISEEEASAAFADQPLGQQQRQKSASPCGH